MFEWHSESCLGVQAGKILHPQNANCRVFIKRTIYHHVAMVGDIPKDWQQEKSLLPQMEGAVPGIVSRDSKWGFFVCLFSLVLFQSFGGIY